MAFSANAAIMIALLMMAPQASLSARITQLPPIPRHTLGDEPNNLMDPISAMRAEICGHMNDKYEKDHSHYQDCLEFMKEACKPGGDKQMDGDKQELSTGKGYCAKFFPTTTTTTTTVSVTTTTTATTAAAEVNEVIATASGNATANNSSANGTAISSNYSRKGGQILGQPLDEKELGGIAEAEAACEKLGEQCAGYTCDSKEHGCTLRSFGRGLRDATDGEVSFVRPGAKFIPVYEKHENKTCAEPLEDDTTSRNASASEARCNELDAKCGGFTCNADESNCTLMAPCDLVPSDANSTQVTYVKNGAGSPALKLPSQGFHGRMVSHDDQKTITSDWLSEFGPSYKGEDHVGKICEKYPDSEWCQRRYPKKEAKSAASPLRMGFAGISLVVMLLAFTA